MDTSPWYRQFWPWFIIALPASVVVAGLTTWWIAARNADSLVVDDYYKEGLAINRVLRKQNLARELGISAELHADMDAVEVWLSGDPEVSALSLKLSHPLDAKYDRELLLALIRPGHFRANISLAGGSRWIWQLEPVGRAEEATWRVDGEVLLPHADAR
jgi:hypothetical protein